MLVTQILLKTINIKLFCSIHWQIYLLHSTPMIIIIIVFSIKPFKVNNNQIRRNNTKNKQLQCKDTLQPKCWVRLHAVIRGSRLLLSPTKNKLWFTKTILYLPVY